MSTRRSARHPIGRVATDVEVKDVNGGSKVSSFILAVGRSADEADFAVLRLSVRRRVVFPTLLETEGNRGTDSMNRRARPFCWSLPYMLAAATATTAATSTAATMAPKCHACRR